jgi:hypothetical protein
LVFIESLFVKEPKRRKNHCIFLLTGAALSDMTRGRQF